MWVGFTILAISWFTLTAVYLGPAFRSGQWLALGVLSVLAGFAGIWLISAGARYGVITSTGAAGAGRATVSSPPR